MTTTTVEVGVDDLIFAIPPTIWRDSVSESLERIAVDSGCVARSEVANLRSLLNADYMRAIRVRESLERLPAFQKLNAMYKLVHTKYPNMPDNLFKAYRTYQA